MLSKINVEYHSFNFESGRGYSKEKVKLNSHQIIIIDGVYSSEHLKDLVDISVLVEYPDDLRRQRLLQREGDEFMKDWHYY